MMLISYLPTTNLSGFWDCENASSIHYNTDHFFPNKILPVLDHVLSSLGVFIHSLLLLAIYIRYKILGTTPLSSLLLINVCLAHLLVCANSILLFLSSKAPLEVPLNATYFNGTNVYTYVADGVEHTFGIVRVFSFTVIYIIRLLHETRPCWLLLHRRSLLRLEKFYCVGVWVVGVAVGGFWTFMGLQLVTRVEVISATTYKIIALSIYTSTESCHLVGMIVSVASILFLAGLLFKHRPTKADPNLSSSSDQYSIYRSIKSCLQDLTLLFLIDLIFDINLVVHFVITLKEYLSQAACFVPIWVDMINYLGTPTNYMYEYHCPDVLQGICTSLVFLLQKPMREKVKLIWRAVCWKAKRFLTSWRDQDSSSAYL